MWLVTKFWRSFLPVFSGYKTYFRIFSLFLSLQLCSCFSSSHLKFTQTFIFDRETFPKNSLILPRVTNRIMDLLDLKSFINSKRLS
uniref:Uncharacterized protein n=1 Tax=Octopus bimaculoides TaxID=37653 RepID=A0A0L8G571_OCTBM